ncbi:MAG: M28 family peptidase [Bacteroidales bacterium]|nr:M28 family peptidase [Bacteroidales bacterium]
MSNFVKSIFLLSLFLAGLWSCQPKTRQPETLEPGTLEPGTTLVVPAFIPDSAYAFVKAQCDFGPRVPGTPSHAACAEYLENTLKRYTPHVQVQSFRSRAFDGIVLNGKNIIASFQPDKRARLMLCAHWDSRPFADHDPDPAKRNQPVMGANDGASGVGVLLEVARLLSTHEPGISVDIIFFDLEDYGPPHDDQTEGKNEHWGLGSQHWSRNPHEYNYRPRYVILLDMVGATDARFLLEGFSMHFAPDKVKKVWDIAHRMGYQEYFPNQRGGFINDDHYFINEIARIPAINIIHLDANSSNGSFFEYWHTTEDTMDKIDSRTLGVVGDVVIQTIFMEK